MMKWLRRADPRTAEIAKLAAEIEQLTRVVEGVTATRDGTMHAAIQVVSGLFASMPRTKREQILAGLKVQVGKGGRGYSAPNYSDPLFIQLYRDAWSASLQAFIKAFEQAEQLIQSVERSQGQVENQE
jgi:hypothetical protein